MRMTQNSGSTSHLCNNMRSFAHTKETESKINWQATPLSREKKREGLSLRWKDQQNNNAQKRTLRFGLRTNFLSVSKIVDKDHTVTFKNGATIKNPQEKVLFIADQKEYIDGIRRWLTPPITSRIDLSRKALTMRLHTRNGITRSQTSDTSPLSEKKSMY